MDVSNLHSSLLLMCKQAYEVGFGSGGRVAVEAWQRRKIVYVDFSVYNLVIMSKPTYPRMFLGIGGRGYARRNLGLRTVPPMSTTYHLNITPPPPLGGGPSFLARFLRLRLF